MYINARNKEDNMKYETIIVELLARIQALEEEMCNLRKLVSKHSQALGVEENDNKQSSVNKFGTKDIKEHITNLKQAAADRGEKIITLKSGDLHKVLPLHNSMPMVCNAMYACMTDGDEIIQKSPSGYSSTLTIKYNL